MKERMRIVVAVIIVAILAVGGYVLMQNRPTPGTVMQPEEKESEVTPASDNDESIDDFQGEITAVAAQNVGYKNSLVITVTNGVTPIQVYVTEETIIRDEADNTMRDRSYLEQGFMITGKGVPAEGGLEATEIIILNESSDIENFPES